MTITAPRRSRQRDRASRAARRDQAQGEQDADDRQGDAAASTGRPGATGNAAVNVQAAAATRVSSASEQHLGRSGGDPSRLAHPATYPVRCADSSRQRRIAAGFGRLAHRWTVASCAAAPARRVGGRRPRRASALRIATSVARNTSGSPRRSAT